MIIEIKDEFFTRLVNFMENENLALYNELKEIKPLDVNSLERARKIRTQRVKDLIKKAEYVQGRYDLKDTVKSKRTFLTYFEELTEEKQKQDTSNNYGNWFSTLQHLKKIVPKNMTFDEIDENFVKCTLP